ncbi:MAG TPA: LEA type 2 family protein [Vicinamibacterales bacterium]|nr:LEA type 2 family protein [Vicinamibacterales bacterium]
MRDAWRLTVLLVALAATLACTALGQLRGVIQPPRFSQSEERPAQLRIIGPSIDMPVGGLSVRLWARVANPNPFGFTLGTLKGTLFLEDERGATADFPLGLPLEAGQETEIPLDLTVSFSDLPGLAQVARNAASARPVAYRLDGTIGVDAGRLGQPVFGPMTLLTGELQTR